jgi:hypothetical protein
MNRNLAIFLTLNGSLFVFSALFAPASRAQTTPTAQPAASKEADASIDQQIAMMRSDLRSNRKQVVAANM